MLESDPFKETMEFIVAAVQKMLGAGEVHLDLVDSETGLIQQSVSHIQDRVALDETDTEDSISRRQGWVTRMALTQQPDFDRMPVLERGDVVSRTAVPLLVGNKVLGVISIIDSNISWPHDDANISDADALQLFANQAAIALDYAQLNKSMEALQEIVTIPQVALLSKSDIESAVEYALWTTCEVTQSDVAELYIFNSNTMKLLTNSYYLKPGDKLKQIPQGTESGVAGLVHVVAKSQAAEFLVNAQMLRFYHIPEVKSLALVPWKARIADARTAIVGVLAVGFWKSREFFSSDRETLNNLATQLGIAFSLEGMALRQDPGFYSCFVSYSSKDLPIARKLHADLLGNKVSCWFAPEDMKIGAPIRPTIDDSIRIHDKLLLVLSEHSVASPWVEREVLAAIEREDLQGKDVLFPIRLDDAVMETDKAWAAEIRRTRHIGDFQRWTDHDAYQVAFERLLRDLTAESE